MNTQSLPLVCGCAGCNKPWLHIYNNLIHVESRHHGHTHVNACTLSLIIEIMRRTLKASTPDDFRAVLPSCEAVPVEVDGREVWGVAMRCHRRECRLPWGYICEGVLIVESWHDQEKHRNRLTLAMLNRILRGDAYSQRRVLVPTLETA